MVSSLVTGDLHITLNQRDDYRWGIFQWLANQAKKHEVDQVIIMGDLTVAKDSHPAVLVNALVQHLVALSNIVPVIILKGNHDYVDPEHPFFNFLNDVNDIMFVPAAYPIYLNVNDHRKRTLLLGNSRQFEFDYELIPWDKYAYIFCHQTFTGAKAENGQEMRGVSVGIFGKSKARIYSGDIHVPQKLGPVKYVGAPYRIRFGDRFEPRVLLLKDGKEINLRYETTGRHLFEVSSVDELKKAKLPREDQVKIRFRLSKEDFSSWKSIKRDIMALAKQRAWDIHGLSVELKVSKKLTKRMQFESVKNPDELVEFYAKREKVDDLTLEIGKKLGAQSWP